MKLWRCDVGGFGPEFFEATTRSKARYRCVRALWSAGYKGYSFKHVNVRRVVMKSLPLFVYEL